MLNANLEINLFRVEQLSLGNLAKCYTKFQICDTTLGYIQGIRKGNCLTNCCRFNFFHYISTLFCKTCE